MGVVSLFWGLTTAVSLGVIPERARDESDPRVRCVTAVRGKGMISAERRCV